MPRRWSDRMGLGALLLVAVFFRVYRLREIPWGINNDVAWNGLYAIRILNGEPYTPFTAEAWGKETFFFYLVAAGFKLFGVGELTLLLPSIGAGALTVIAFHAVSRDLLGDRAAFVGAFVLAAMAWHVTLSRTGYRAILSPLFLLLLLGAFFRAIDAPCRRARLAWFAAAGVAWGLGHHGYFAFRVATPLLLVLLAREAGAGNGVLRRNASGLVLMAGVGAAIVLPLVVYAVRNPDIFFARTGHLWIGARVREAGSWAPFWDNLRDNLLMFHYRAHVGNFFNNGWPILSAPLGLFFAAGLAALAAGWRRRGPFVALAVGFFAHLPSLLSAPDATRSLAVTLTVAWAAAAAVEAVLRLPCPTRVRPALAVVLTAGLVACEFHFYFHRLGRDPAAQFAYAGIHTAIGRRVAELARDHVTFVSHGHNFETTQFLWRDVPPGRIVGLGVEPPELVAPAALLANLDDALAVEAARGQGRAFVIEAHPANEPLLRRVREALPGGEERAHVDARFGGLAYYSYVVAPTSR